MIFVNFSTVKHRKTANQNIINLVGPCKSQLYISDQNTRDYHFLHFTFVSTALAVLFTLVDSGIYILVVVVVVSS